MTFDDEAVYELLTEVRTNAEQALDLIWQATKDKDLWRKCQALLSYDVGHPIHRGIDEGVTALFEELGYEFCEECGERVDDCTCEEADEDAENEAVEVAATVGA